MEGFGRAANGGRTVVGAANGGSASYAASNMYVHGSDSRTSTYKDSNWPVVRPWHGGQELKRKKRIAKYKLYSVEGKVKSSLRKGFRWFKKTCSRIVHGF
ncbi:hypothetical protein Pfo_005186 [Paulownia fortunei]|nr:hypothetical protein Pfo_005186 [Paulownia fortunei]